MEAKILPQIRSVDGQTERANQGHDKNNDIMHIERNPFEEFLMLASFLQPGKIFALVALSLLEFERAECAADSDRIFIGVRSDARPFSYGKQDNDTANGACDPGQQYRGYVVDICREFLSTLSRRNGQTYQLCFKPVTPEASSGAGKLNRFNALEEHKIDLLCGATTATLEVANRFHSSLPIFLSTSTFMINRASVEIRLQNQEPLRIGFLSDTTSAEQAGPEAAALRGEILRILGTTLGNEPVALGSHSKVPNAICTRDETHASCKKIPFAKPAAQPARTEWEKPTSCPKVISLWNEAGVFGWMQFTWNCTPPFVATRKWASKRLHSVRRHFGGEDRSYKTATVASFAAEKKAPESFVYADVIDIYISDRPILKSIYEEMERQGIAENIEISDHSLMSQPYAVIFPDPAKARPAIKELNLPLKFNRYLVKSLFDPDKSQDLRRRLDLHFEGVIDASFLHMLPILGRWPMGREPVTEP